MRVEVNKFAIHNKFRPNKIFKAHSNSIQNLLQIVGLQNVFSLHIM